MPTIMGFETANIAICISVGAFAISALSGLLSSSTYYQNYIRNKPKLEVGVQVNGFKDTLVIEGSSVVATLHGTLLLANRGNKTTFVNYLTPFLLRLDDVPQTRRELLDKLPIIETEPELSAILDKTRAIGSSFRYDPDITRQDIINIFVEAGEYEIINWRAPVTFDFSHMSNSEGDDFLWGIRLIILNAKNKPVRKTVSGSIIHYSGNHPNGAVDGGAFGFTSYLIPRNAL